MMADGSAAAGLRCDERLYPERVEDAGSCSIDGRQHRGLGAAAEQQYLAWVLSRWPRSRGPARAHFGAQGREPGHDARNDSTDAEAGAKQPTTSESLA